MIALDGFKLNSTENPGEVEGRKLSVQGNKNMN
jgi:hypothetical protein